MDSTGIEHILLPHITYSISGKTKNYYSPPPNISSTVKVKNVYYVLLPHICCEVHTEDKSLEADTAENVMVLYIVTAQLNLNWSWSLT